MKYKNNKRQFDRCLLPCAAIYYCQQFPRLKLKSEWTAIQCCFHHDTKPSLSINLKSGGYHCFSCGAHGGDVITFQMQRYDMTFVQSVDFFGAWRYE